MKIDNEEPFSYLEFHPLERLLIPRPVDRIEYIAERARGLRVLDLGAHDETEISKSQDKSWRWLHAEIAKTAKEVLGVDNSSAVKQSGQIETPFGSKIVWGDVHTLDDIINDFAPELIVAGELIEHTEDTLCWLSALAKSASGASIIITTPNATSILNIFLSLINRENCHPDHLQVYSFKTLAVMARRIPIFQASILPYYYDPHMFRGRFSSSHGLWISLVDRVVLRPLQYLFPLTSFGLILEGKLGDA